MPDFNPSYSVSFSQGRRSEVYAFQGYGTRPRVYSPGAQTWRAVGINAPTQPATITQSATVKYYVARIDVELSGLGYTKGPPSIVVEPPYGDGTAAQAQVRLTASSIGAVDMTEFGKGYTLAVGTSNAPAVSMSYSPERPLDPLNVSDPLINNENATLRTIIRAHFRGKYLCFYRFVYDLRPDAEGGPLYSNLSPVREIDCGEGKESIVWTFPQGAWNGAKTIELWRTTSSQAITLFRVARIVNARCDGQADTQGNWSQDVRSDGAGAYTDAWTDWELADLKRGSLTYKAANPGQGQLQLDTTYLAMPILLPNGELNANRFGVAPSTKAVGVMFQDRLWMAVDTSGTNPNELRFSESDEPESCPDVNSLVLQTNLRTTDYITALIPYSGALIVAQSRHCHRLTYVSQPLIDSAVFLIAYRGVLNQRCWDIFNGDIYAMDEQGCYSMDAQGNIKDLTLGLADVFRDRIDYAKSRWFIVRVERGLRLLRVGLIYKGEGGIYPTRQLVYSIDYETWWEETYPATLCGAAQVTLANGGSHLAYGTLQGKLLRPGVGCVDDGTGYISQVVITNPGRGYLRPPAISAPADTNSRHGAEFECALDTSGSLTGITIKNPGTGYTNGALTISAPDAGGVQATATFTSATSSSAPVHWFYKSGCMEFTTDSHDRRGGEAQSRHIAVTYRPTTNACNLFLQAYYNNAKHPRSNVARRDRGTGFVHSDTAPAAVLNMQVSPQQDAEEHGVARALFGGRTLDDIVGNDRHISISLSGRQEPGPSGDPPVAIHQVDVYGVNEQG